MAMPKGLSLAKNAVYNTIGSVFYCFCQWAVTMIVVRLSKDYDNAGILQLAMSVTNVFTAVSLYNIRTYQISDINNKYSAGEYIFVRFITSAAAAMLCLIYALVSGYGGVTLLCIMTYMCFKIIESVVDVYHGIDQRYNRMDYICVSYVMRGVLSLAAFIVVFVVTDSVFPAIVAMTCTTAVVLTVYDIGHAGRFCSVKPVFIWSSVKKMLLECFPAVMSLAAFTAVTTVPRQFLEGMYGKNILGYYATVATPVVIIQLLATSIFNPMLGGIAVAYNSRNTSALKRTGLKVIALIVAFTLFAYAGVYLLGEKILVLIYGGSIREYCWLMYAIIGCAVLYVVCWLCTNMLIIMRRMRVLIVTSVVSLGLSALLGKAFISGFYMNGVSLCILFCYAVYILLNGVCIAIYVKKDFTCKTEESNDI